MIRRIACLVLALLLGSSAAAQPVPGLADAQSLFVRANSSYSAGADSLATDRSAALESFSRAEADYRQLLAANSLSRGDRAKVHYNLANTLLLAGDAPGAILEFRRARSHAAALSDRGLRARIDENLAQARTRAGTPTPTETRNESIRGRIELATRAIPTSVRFHTFATAFGVFWVLAAWRTLGRTAAPPRWFIASFACVWILLGATLAVELWRPTASRHGVVLTDGTIPRAGPDDVTFEAVAAAPLTPGTEFELLETRGGEGMTPVWVRIRPAGDPAADSRGVWVPRSAVELFNPA